MLDFQLFRIKIFGTQQIDIFQGEITRSGVLRNTIKSSPQAELRSGVAWHIGKLTDIDNAAVYFRFGRTTKSDIEVFVDGDFRSQSFEVAPYTHVVVDIEHELLAIAKKTKLSAKTIGIANKMQDLFNIQAIKQGGKIEFAIDDLKDPKELLSYVQRADSIARIWIRFKRPNSWDANEFLVKPLQKIVKEMGANEGKAEFKGDALDHDVTKQIVTSAARTADDASVTMMMDEQQKSITKRLKGNSVNVSQEDLLDPDDLRELIKKVRDAYEGIR